MQSKSYANLLEEFETRVQKVFQDYEDKSQPFFDYLATYAQRGFTAEQFLIYRDNFFFRTLSTIPSIAKLMIAAAYNGDYATIADAGKNLFDESGLGNADRVHSALLEHSHNFHGEKMFNLPPIKLIDVKDSKHLVNQVQQYRKVQTSLYESEKYALILAVSFAQETVASSMLRNFYESLFVPYKNAYTDTEFESIALYFLAHIQGVEQRHAEDAKQAVLRECSDLHTVNLCVQGMLEFLNAQSDLWMGMHDAMG